MSRQLLFSLDKNDFKITSFRGTGNGGQNRNKVETCVRIEHSPSNVVTTGTEYRTQFENKKSAFKKMASTPKFIAWIKMKAYTMMKVMLTEQEIQEVVNKMMETDSFKYEILEDGKWKEVTEEYFKNLPSI